MTGPTGRHTAAMALCLQCRVQAPAAYLPHTLPALSRLCRLRVLQVVAGDDTWVQLKPRDARYSAVHPYPSFNVRDLHTVDDGVTEVR